MDYQAEIQKENGAISRLTQELKQVKIKPRTINYQFQNQGNVRGITQRVLVVKKQRKQINSR